MRLLLDNNLSRRLVDRLSDLYPGITHVELVGLSRARDAVIWEYARDHGCIIVTKDADFIDLAVIRGVPPKVVWVRVGNCTTSDIERLLRHQHAAIESFAADVEAGVLSVA